jgi:hypothetical protein
MDVWTFEDLSEEIVWMLHSYCAVWADQLKVA